MKTLPAQNRFAAFLLFVCLAIGGLIAWMAWQGRSSAIERAVLTAENLAGVLDQHTARAVEAVDLALDTVRGRMEAEGLPHRPSIRIHRLLRERTAATALIQSLLIFDRTGRLLHESAQYPARPLRIDVQPWLARPVEDRLRIEPPAAAPDGGPGTIAFSRRIEGPDGGFAGVVVAVVSVGHFQRFYDGIEIGSRGAVALFSADGTLLVREPSAPAALGVDFSDEPLFHDWLARRPSGSFASRSPIDGVLRLNSYRRVADHPFVVMVSIARDDALAEWRGDLLRQIALGLALCGIVLALGLYVSRQMRRRFSAEGRADAALLDLKHKHAVIETILRTLPDGVCLLDRDMKLVGCNDQLFRIFRIDRAAALGAPDPVEAFCRILAGRGDLGEGAFAAQMARARAAIRRAGRSRRRLADGRWIEGRHTPVGEQGYLAVFRDVTEETGHEMALRDAYGRAEDQAQQLAAAARELQEARRAAEADRIAAEAANLTKSRFLANMSHELRTPLNAINGFSEIIAGLYLGRDAIDKYREYARDIHDSGQHLLALINGVLDISKVEAGRMELWESTVDLTATVFSALKMVEPKADAKGVSLNFETPGRPILMRADAQKLLQIFLNLLSNAVKFTPQGGRVTAAVSSGFRGPTVIVADTGIGIAENALPKLFEPFSQIDSEIARENTGTGLGMPLTRSLIELHGGTIAVESAEGAGTTVTIRLPRERLVPLQPLAQAV